MGEIIAKLEEIKATLIAQGIQNLQSDVDLELQVVAALPRVRQLLQVLRDIQAQQVQS